MGRAQDAAVVIANGAALSGEIDLRSFRLLGVILPAAWTAADLSFQAAAKPTAEGGVYGEVFIDPGTGVGAALLLDAAASQVTFLDNEAIVGGCMLKVRSGPSGGPVNQAAARTLTLILQTL